jgi:hypothetical protein
MSVSVVAGSGPVVVASSAGRGVSSADVVPLPLGRADTRFSIASQTSSSVISGHYSVASSSTPTAAASFPASFT